MLCPLHPKHPSPLTFVIAFHTLPTSEVPTLRPKNSVPRTPQLVLAVLIAVRHTISPIKSITLRLDTAKRVHVAVTGTGGLVGGFDVAVDAVRAGVDGYAGEA